MAAAVGMHLRLEYGDHNEDFARFLPRTGTIAGLVTTDEKIAWVLFKLDDPLTYEGTEQSYLLLRSRWVKRQIGEKKPTSVFILLAGNAKAVKPGFDVRDFHHAAWGMANTLEGRWSFWRFVTRRT